jgi:pyridinium-3,5-bisthiocarboxylic acid mononucleotide nickel chelatase
MARVLYFDAFNGVAGDMVLGALLDLGLPLEHLHSELSKLHLDEFELHAEPVERKGLRAVNFTVAARSPGGAKVAHWPVHDDEHGESHDHAHGGHGDHQHRHSHSHRHGASPEAARAPAGRHRGLREILGLLDASSLNQAVKERATLIFGRLGEAEAKVHNTSVEEVHFHEVGAIDAIVDIVGACIGFEYFEVDEFHTAPINLGGGTVTFSHGTWPVPAPATAELVKGFPTLLGTAGVELTTPTGAAIVTTLARPGSVPPPAQYSRWGYGAGDRELPDIPNVLRIMLGESARATGVTGFAALQEEIVILEATLDDQDGQAFGYFLDLALAQGALDLYYTPVQMKKNRPAVQLTLLCRLEDEQKMLELLFEETTTLGVRSSTSKRWVLPREILEVMTSFGPVRVKVGRLGGKAVNFRPEYEDLRAIAERTGQSLKAIRRLVLQEIDTGEL